jgi:hypothetical protein
MTTIRNFYKVHQDTEFVPNLKIYVLYTVVFYVWVLLEGIFRKWLFPGAASALYLVKFAIWGGATLFYILEGRKMSYRTYPFLWITLLYIFYGFLSALIAWSNYNILVGLLGIMMHFTFISIVFILPIVITNRSQIDKIFEILNYVVIGMAGVSFFQYFAPPDSFINRYTNDEMVAVINDSVRVTSVFSFISTYAAFLNYVLLAMLVKLLSTSKFSGKTLVLIFSLGLGIVSSFMTGSRGLTGLLGVEFTIVALVSSFTSGSRFIVYLFRIILMGGVFFLVVSQTSVGRKSFNNLNKRFKDNNDAESRLIDTFTPLKFFKSAGWGGFGIGTYYQGASSVVNDWKDMPRDAEEEHERLVLELGLLGYLIVLATRLSICVFAFWVFLSLRDRYLKMLSLAFFIMIALPLFGLGNLTTNWMDAILYWSIVGLLVVFRNIDKKN